MPENLITDEALDRRAYWVKEIQNLSGNFGSDSQKLEQELNLEVSKGDTGTILNHLRLCGNIPEIYGHDSSEEKLYSKYTDILLAIAFRQFCSHSLVLSERADSADVEVIAKKFNFVADAKAFRLSRSAKNQKDFKVQAMDGWKKGKLFAMVVCPIYQLPTRSSQIYEQASSRNVCIFTYSHLSLLVNYANESSKENAEELLFKVLVTVGSMNPSKDAYSYWKAINKTILDFDSSIFELWAIEKKAASDSTRAAKLEALRFLAAERDRIVKMSHKEAIEELLNMSKVDGKIKIINSVSDTGLFSIK